MRHRPCSLRRGGRREVRIPSLSIERAHGTPDARCVRSLVCENEKAHESSRHENTGHARRSVRGAFAGLLREQGPRRPTHVCWATDGGGLTSHRRPKACDGSASGRKGDCAGTSRFGPVRFRCGSSSPSRAALSGKPESVTRIRRSNTDRVHRIPPRVRDDHDPPLKVRRDERNVVLLQTMSIQLGDERSQIFLDLIEKTNLEHRKIFWSCGLWRSNASIFFESY